MSFENPTINQPPDNPRVVRAEGVGHELVGGNTDFKIPGFEPDVEPVVSPEPEALPVQQPEQIGEQPSREDRIQAELRDDSPEKQLARAVANRDEMKRRHGEESDAYRNAQKIVDGIESGSAIGL